MGIVNNNDPFDSNTSSRKVNRNLDITSDRGWSPVLVPVLNGTSVYLKLSNWIEGEGDMPFDPTLDTYYLGEISYVTDIEDAIDIATQFLTIGHLKDIIDVSTMTFTLEDSSTTGKKLVLGFNTLNGDSYSLESNILTKATIDYTTPSNNSNDTGSTTEAIANTLLQLKNFLVINDYTGTPWVSDQALSQSAVLTAIAEAKAQFDVPLIELTANSIASIEGNVEGVSGEPGITPINPYYAIVSDDNRRTGEHTEECTITCVQECCDLNTDGGYEGRAIPEGISGCRCDPGQDEILAECLVTITVLGSVGDRYELWYDNEILSWAEISTLTTADVVSQLIANLVTGCGENAEERCTVLNVTSNSFTLQALPGTGSIPNTLNHDVVVTGTAEMTFTQSVMGVDHIAETYRGVYHHLIAFDGTDWHDFGPTLGFGNNNEDTDLSSCVCTFLSQTDTPSSYTGYEGYFPIVNGDENALEFMNYTFLNLHDTPSTYIANYKVKINSVGDELKFVDDSFLNLNDVNDTVYAAKVGYVPSVNNIPNGLELVDAQTLVNNTYLGLTDVYDTTFVSNDGLIPVVNESNNKLVFTDPQSLVNNTFIGLEDTPNDYSTTTTFRPTSYGEQAIVNTTGDGIEFVSTAMRRGSNGESTAEDVVTLNNDDDVLQPQHIQIMDDDSNTTSWGSAQAGRLSFQYTDMGGYTTCKLFIWAHDNSGVWNWEQIFGTSTN